MDNDSPDSKLERKHASAGENEEDAGETREYTPQREFTVSGDMPNPQQPSFDHLSEQDSNETMEYEPVVNRAKSDFTIGSSQNETQPPTDQTVFAQDLSEFLEEELEEDVDSQANTVMSNDSPWNSEMMAEPLDTANETREFVQEGAANETREAFPADFTVGTSQQADDEESSEPVDQTIFAGSLSQFAQDENLDIFVSPLSSRWQRPEQSEMEEDKERPRISTINVRSPAPTEVRPQDLAPRRETARIEDLAAIGNIHNETAQLPPQMQKRKLDVGEIVNQKYRIVELLGRGAFGLVYKVENLMLSNKVFALKVLPPQRCQDPRFRERFIREVEVAMEFAHEHAVQIRDFGKTEQGELYFTMDFSPGLSLKHLLDKERFLDGTRVLRIIRQVLSALRNAHQKGIVHRDLKPDNILLENRLGEDHALVLDFGIAKVLTDSPQYLFSMDMQYQRDLESGNISDKLREIFATHDRRLLRDTTVEVQEADRKWLIKEMNSATYSIIYADNALNVYNQREITQEFTVIGTANYMSPEQASGEKVDERTDIYAVGVIMYQMITGQTPFSGAPGQVFTQHLLKDPVPPSKINPKISRKVEKIIAKAMCKDKNGRFANAGEFIVAIDEVLYGSKKTKKMDYRTVLVGAAITVIFLAGLTAAIYWYESDIHAREHQKFTQAIENRQFFVAQQNIAAIANSWFFQSEAEQLRINLVDAKTQFLDLLVAQGKTSLQQRDFANAQKLFLQVQKERENALQAEIYIARTLAEAQALLAEKQWKQALVKLQTVQEYSTETPVHAPQDFITEAIARCELELSVLEWREQGIEMLARQNFAEALKLFQKARQAKPQSAQIEILATEKIIVAYKYLQEKNWEKAHEQLLDAQSYCREQLPQANVDFLAAAIVSSQTNLDAQTRERQRQRQVKKDLLALRRHLKKKNWPGVASLLAKLREEVRLPQEKKNLAHLQKYYPPATLSLFTKASNQSPWKRATGSIASDTLYQIRLRVSLSVYVYGFQIDSSDKMQSIFPSDERGVYSFKNPVKRGEYYLPAPGAAFLLDRRKGVERFYLLYSNTPLHQPEQVLLRHLRGEKKYATVVEISLEHS